jgi:hypothetical protein
MSEYSPTTTELNVNIVHNRPSIILLREKTFDGKSTGMFQV